MGEIGKNGSSVAGQFAAEIGRNRLWFQIRDNDNRIVMKKSHDDVVRGMLPAHKP